MVGARSEVAAIQRRKTVGFPGEQFAEGRKEFGFSVFAEPLELMLVFVRAEPGEFGDTRIEPTEGIRKFQGMKLADFIPVAKGDEAGLRIGAAVEREDEGAIEAGGVVGAGGMAKMVLEVEGPGAAAKEVLKLLLGRRLLVTSARTLAGNEPFGDGNGAAIGEAEMVFVEAAVERKAWELGTFLTAELFFLDGEEHGLLVDQGDGGAASERRDSEDMHELRRQGPPIPRVAAAGLLVVRRQRVLREQ